MTDWRHTLQRVKDNQRYENSRPHENCINFHMHKSKGKDIYNLMFTNKRSIRQKNIIERKQVLERIIDVVKLIGKVGLLFALTDLTLFLHFHFKIIKKTMVIF